MGFWAKLPLIFFLPLPGIEEGQGAPAAGKEGERRRAAWGIDSPPRFEGWRPVEAAPRQQAAAGPGRCGGGAAGPRRRLELGGNGEGSEGSLLLFSPWAGVERGGAPTVAGERRARLCAAAAQGAWKEG